MRISVSFIFTDPPPTEIYTLSLHDALPICTEIRGERSGFHDDAYYHEGEFIGYQTRTSTDLAQYDGDRKSTRLNSSHVKISYAVFCLKKKNNSTADSTCDSRHVRNKTYVPR